MYSHLSTCQICLKQVSPSRNDHHHRTCAQTEVLVSYPDPHSDQEAAVVDVSLTRDSHDGHFHCPKVGCTYAHKDVHAMQVSAVLFLLAHVQVCHIVIRITVCSASTPRHATYSIYLVPTHRLCA